MELTATKGAIAHFIEPEETDVEYEHERTSHPVTFDGLTSNELWSAIVSKCEGGVHGSAYFYDEGGVRSYGTCSVMARSTSTVRDEIRLYNGTVIIEERTYWRNFSARPEETQYLNQPNRVVALTNSYYETPSTAGLRLSSDLSIYESTAYVGLLHLTFTVETLVYDTDADHHVIGYHYEQSSVDYTNNGSAYGNYWIPNRRLSGDTIEYTVEIAGDEEDPESD